MTPPRLDGLTDAYPILKLVFRHALTCLLNPCLRSVTGYTLFSNDLIGWKHRKRLRIFGKISVLLFFVRNFQECGHADERFHWQIYTDARDISNDSNSKNQNRNPAAARAAGTFGVFFTFFFGGFTDRRVGTGAKWCGCYVEVASYTSPKYAGGEARRNGLQRHKVRPASN